VDILKLQGGEEQLPPIDLRAVLNLVHSRGMQNGGWFIFEKGDRWAYRSNEFSNETYTECKTSLVQQGALVRSVFTDLLGPTRAAQGFTNSFSLEKVHAIWHGF
jgi:hypothetical protein